EPASTDGSEARASKSSFCKIAGNGPPCYNLIAVIKDYTIGQHRIPGAVILAHAIPVASLCIVDRRRCDRLNFLAFFKVSVDDQVGPAWCASRHIYCIHDEIPFFLSVVYTI